MDGESLGARQYSMNAPSSVIQLIESSGNTFHAKVARWFHANNWHVVVSPYYLDQTQSKARELDLVVEKLWPIRSSPYRQEGHVLVRLFVECKYVASESVLWFAPKNVDAATKLVCGTAPFRVDNVFTNKHHYLSLSPKVAKLFASSGKSQDNDPFYKALNQCLNAVVAMEGAAPSHPELRGNAWRGKLVTLSFPVIVCSSFARLYAVEFLTDSEPSEVSDSFQLEVEYAFIDRQGRQRADYFLIDVVAFDQLAGLEAAIKAGAEAAAFLAAS